MNIGLVTQAYYPVLGGVTEHVWHLGQELEHRGHRVTVITGGVPRGLMRRNDADADRGLRVLRHGWQIPMMSNGANVYLTVGWKLGRMLQRIELQERFDLVHIHCALDPGLPLIASKTMHSPKVATYHSARQMTGTWTEKIPVIFRSVWLDAIEKIQAHVAVSPAAEKYIHHFFPQVQMAVIPNGVDTTRFTPSQQPRNLAKPLTILYVGRMDPRKGAKFLFAALPELEKRLTDYKIVVVGTGWMKKYYDVYIPLTLRRRVEFKGYVAPADLPGYYQQADIYCSPATGNESFGIVLLEAMACGTPVVASDIDGYRAVVTSGREGLLVPPRHPQYLAEAIITLAKDAVLRRRMGQAGRTTAEQYAWPRIVDQLEPIYQRISTR